MRVTSSGTAQLTAIDAFAGAGGLGLGLVAAGYEMLYSFDLDELAVATQRANATRPEHRIEVEDVNNLLGGELLRRVGLRRGELDLLAGGPPCQGFSVQRGRQTNEDPRNALVAAYAQLIEEVHPRAFVMENVPGLASPRSADALGSLWEMTERVGYRVYKQVLDAQDFGVPQRRRRYVVVGIRGDEDRTFIWPETSSPERKTVRETIGWLPPVDSSHGYSLHRADRLSALNMERLGALKEGQGREHLPEHLLADCHRRSSDLIGHRNVYGRMSWDEVAPTITARFDSFTRGKFGHPEQIRSISLLEGALLQTFPVNYTFVGNKVDVARQIGNAVPPRLGEAIGRAISAVLAG
jgi:DNA (cytosine-5)-methyltransferase 1